jgi:putative ABC transport system permease protein
LKLIFRLSLRNLASNRLRFALTTFAVLLGVSFVVSSFVLTDGLLRTFDNIVEDANAEIDAQVRAESDFEEVQSIDRPIDEDLVDVVLSVEGVEEANPGTQSTKIVPVGANGEPVETTGAPIMSFNWNPDSSTTALTIVEGEEPEGQGEFAIDTSSASREDLVVGETYDVIGGAGREPFTLVGITRFGDENALAGAVLMSFTLDELQRLDGTEGQIRWISVVGKDGVGPDELIESIDEALPPDLEVVSGEQIIAEDQEDFSDVVSIFGNILLGFALVAVFVSTFIISNTFNILLGQRVRQLALLRALGASSRQVRASALLESFIIGVTASLLGLAGGRATGRWPARPHEHARLQSSEHGPDHLRPHSGDRLDRRGGCDLLRVAGACETGRKSASRRRHERRLQIRLRGGHSSHDHRHCSRPDRHRRYGLWALRRCRQHGSRTARPRRRSGADLRLRVPFRPPLLEPFG